MGMNSSLATADSHRPTAFSLFFRNWHERSSNLFFGYRDGKGGFSPHWHCERNKGVSL